MCCESVDTDPFAGQITLKLQAYKCLTMCPSQVSTQVLVILTAVCQKIKCDPLLLVTSDKTERIKMISFRTVAT